MGACERGEGGRGGGGGEHHLGFLRHFSVPKDAPKKEAYSNPYIDFLSSSYSPLQKRTRDPKTLV